MKHKKDSEVHKISESLSSIFLHKKFENKTNTNIFQLTLSNYNNSPMGMNLWTNNDLCQSSLSVMITRLLIRLLLSCSDVAGLLQKFCCFYRSYLCVYVCEFWYIFFYSTYALCSQKRASKKRAVLP